MYYAMRASAPSLHREYRLSDIVICIYCRLLVHLLYVFVTLQLYHLILYCTVHAQIDYKFGAMLSQETHDDCNLFQS